ncbi:DMT family transporter [Pseudooceanicola nitratireducens]|uniref:DMT family transporter n=1 Tax=Pseudooceanicola nitratireducens TaxID=517719 RepID=UPI0023F1FE87|nr:DMT family transporter [Pseudooceanicola nitratireducens]
MTPSRAGHLAMLLFSALVAGSFSLGVLAAPHIAPAALNAVRFVIAAVIVGTAAALTTGIPRSAFRGFWRYLLMGGVFGTYFVLMFEGLKTADAVAASAVFTLVPVMAAGFGWLLLRQRTTPRMALALAIGGAGAVWVIFRADPVALLRFQIGKGEMIYFWGCVAHALYTPLVPKLNRGEPAVVFTFGMLCGATIMVGGYGAADILATDWLNLPGIVWITILYVAVFASASTFVLMQFASLRLPSAKVMAYTYLVPSWVILWEIGKGAGLPPMAILAGVALTILSLLLLLKD